MDDTSRRRATGRLAAAEAARLAVARLAWAFDAAHLPVAPLKGVLLIHAFGRDPLERALSDVDLWVPPDRLDEATDLAAHAGWRVAKEEPGGRQRLLLPKGEGLAVDLHGALFPHQMFRLEATGLFQRARVDTASFGAPVLVLEPLDVFAHLVGHAAVTFLFEHRSHHLNDLAWLATRESLSPDALAERLKQTGLEVAARYVLRLAARQGDAFAPKLLRALGRDVAGDALAWTVRQGVPLLPTRRGLGLVPPAVLHRPVTTSALNLGSALLRRVASLRRKR